MNPTLLQNESLRIGIIIPTYNRPELLMGALKSLQNQTYTHWRAVVVNDVSTLDYQAIENQFAVDERIQFVRREVNGGVNQACNTGLDVFAESKDVDFIAIMDDDDVYAPDYFAAAIEQIQKHPKYGWFMSNNFGEQKKSSRRIITEGELDYVDDYIYGKFRGDKGRLIAAPILKDLRFDGRFRGSHRWPFFTKVAQRTKIWAFPHDSVCKRYLDGGITRSVGRPMSLRSIRYSVYKHWYVIRLHPEKAVAYKYLILESLKVIPRAVRLGLGCLNSRNLPKRHH